MGRFERKRVMVTRGGGFIGSHLCERLCKSGCDVLCVDNFFTGTRDNIRHLLDHPFFEVMRHDVTFPLYVEVDEIYNLACPASPIHYQFDPVQTTKTSVIGAINMLGLAKRVKARILQASPVKCMVTRKSIHSRKITGGGLIPLDFGLAAMKASAVLRLFFLIISGSIKWKSRLPGSSILMGSACTPTMDGSFPTLLCKHLRATRLPYMETAPRPVPSVISMIWLKA